MRYSPPDRPGGRQFQGESGQSSIYVHKIILHRSDLGQEGGNDSFPVIRPIAEELVLLSWSVRLPGQPQINLSTGEPGFLIQLAGDI